MEYLRCKRCGGGVEKGRGSGGRRAYRCTKCGKTWSEGNRRTQPKEPQVSGYQFKDTKGKE